jgi:hypothetical protein
MEKLLNESEKDRIRLLYESKGIILSEDNILNSITRKALSWVGKNEDDIAMLFKTSERALAKSLDDIIEIASKQKSISALDDIQMKLMHIYNPSGLAENIPQAQLKMKNFLNGYSKSKGKTKWSEIRDEVSGATPKPQSQAKPNPDHVQVRQNPVGAIFGNKLSGNKISNGSFTNVIKDIDSSKITNWGGSIDNYNKIIANAIKTGNYDKVSRGGFEKFGITDFREFLKNNIVKINEVVPETGRWSVTFK